MYITSTGGWITSKTCAAQITKKKNRLKVYPTSKDKNQVYLNDGDEFEIELFNPKTNPILAKISINGKRISERGIILNPGQRVFLERFLDSPDKLKFSTYKVNNSQEVREAIENNGLVKIDFYDEISSSIYGGSTITLTPNPWSNTGTFYNHNLTGSGSSTSFTTNSVFNNNITTTYTSSVGGSLDLTNKRSASIETGRVEHGSKSDQDFQNGQGNFNSYPSNVIEYRILPIAQKNIEAKEIRSYCTECGTRNKQDWKFCPTCGNKF